MFDIGWSELLIIAVVLIVVVGPKDLPPMLRAFGKTMTRFRKVAGEFRAQFDEALREADLDEVRQTIADAQKLNPAHSLREAMNPLRQMGNDIKADLQRSTTVERTPEPQILPPAETASAGPVTSAAAVEPQPVIAPPPAVVAETIARPKAVRKPRAKAEIVVTEMPAAVVDTEAAPAKAARKPRIKTEALAVADSVPVVTEVVSTARAARQPRIKVDVAAAAAPSVVEPAQVGLPAGRSKRTARKTAATAPEAMPADAPAIKKDDA
jgi:sec-independent protein translocase protein TatB